MSMFGSFILLLNNKWIFCIKQTSGSEKKKQKNGGNVFHVFFFLFESTTNTDTQTFYLNCVE